MSKYVDLNSSYRETADDNSATVYDMDVIKQSLTRLFQTRKNSDPFNRGYGSSLYNLLFENSVDVSDVQMFLYMDITEFEPRVSLSPMDLTIEKTNNHTAVIRCTFTVPALNNNIGQLETTVSGG